MDDAATGGSERWRIGHFFADVGVESEPLSAFGDVHRFGLDPIDNPFTVETYEVDLAAEDPDVEPFDLGLFHPPCHRWTQRADETAENLIPRSRELAEYLCDEWIIENQTDAPLREPVVLDGSMFGLPVEYERAFETSYPVEQPRRRSNWKPQHRVENTRPRDYWKTVKGVTWDYRAKDLILSGTPAAYINYLVRPLVDPYHEPDNEQARLIPATDGGGTSGIATTDSDQCDPDGGAPDDEAAGDGGGGGE